jgi:hypothetical protein
VTQDSSLPEHSFDRAINQNLAELKLSETVRGRGWNEAGSGFRLRMGEVTARLIAAHLDDF